MKDDIDLEVTLRISRELSWQLLTRQEHIVQWFGPHVRLDAVAGGAFREIWSRDGRQVVTSGRVLACHPPDRISWSWADDDWPVTTQLSLTLDERRGGTVLRLRHSGWSMFPAATGNDLRDATKPAGVSTWPA